MKAKILLIEDEPTQIEIYQDALRKEGFQVETLRWGFEGLDRLEEIKKGRKEKPDLILLDLILPDINGIEILEKAKKDEELKDIPFFVLTNYTDLELEKECWKLGVAKYIAKANYTPSELVKIIKDWLKEKKSNHGDNPSH